MSTFGALVYRDGAIVSFFFVRKCKELFNDSENKYRYGYMLTLILNSQPKLLPKQQRENYKLLREVFEVKRVFSFLNNKVFELLWKCGLLRVWMIPHFSRYIYFRTNTIMKLRQWFVKKDF